jgi:hypothetical protein
MNWNNFRVVQLQQKKDFLMRKLDFACQESRLEGLDEYCVEWTSELEGGEDMLLCANTTDVQKVKELNITLGVRMEGSDKFWSGKSDELEMSSSKLFTTLKRRCVVVRRVLGTLATRLQKETNTDSDKKSKNGGKGDSEKVKNANHKHTTEVGRQEQKEDDPNLEPDAHKSNVEDMEAVVVLDLVALAARQQGLPTRTGSSGFLDGSAAFGSLMKDA